jgi:hypothetical protein
MVAEKWSIFIEDVPPNRGSNSSGSDIDFLVLNKKKRREINKVLLELRTKWK